MKKLMIAAFAVAFSAMAQAASIDWKYTATSDEVGMQVYLFTTEIAASYASFDALIANAIVDGGNGTIESKKVGPKTNYLIASKPMQDDSITKSTAALYAILVSGDDATEYKYGTIATNGLVYDPANQETSTGVLEITSAMFTSTGTIGSGEAIPEPTSALMLLVGLAGLALKRKVA